MKKEKKNLHCASGPRFKDVVRFWVGLQLSDEDFQLNFKSQKEKEVLQSQNEWDSCSSPVQVHLIMQIVTKQPWKSSLEERSPFTPLSSANKLCNSNVQMEISL